MDLELMELRGLHWPTNQNTITSSIKKGMVGLNAVESNVHGFSTLPQAYIHRRRMATTAWIRRKDPKDQFGMCPFSSLHASPIYDMRTMAF
jgi:hypothetical protein